MPPNPTSTSWLPVSIVLRIEPFAAHRGVGDTARGDRGFVRAYADAEHPNQLDRMPDRLETWAGRRERIVAAHLRRLRREPLYEWRGPHKGWPSRRHLLLLLWAYAPDVRGLRLWLDAMAQAEATPRPRAPRPALAVLGQLRGRLRRRRIEAIAEADADTVTDPIELRWFRVVRELGYTGSSLEDLAAEAGLPVELLEESALCGDPDLDLDGPLARARACAFLGGAGVGQPNAAAARQRVARRYGWTPGMKARYPQAVESPVDRCLHAAADVAALDSESPELLTLCEDAAELATVETP